MLPADRSRPEKENTYIAYHSCKKMQGVVLKYLVKSFFRSKYLKNGCYVLKYDWYFVYSIILAFGQGNPVGLFSHNVRVAGEIRKS